MSRSRSHPIIEQPTPWDAIVAGHICLDVIPTLLGEKIEFLPGKLVEAGRIVTATGGAVSNTGLALHRLGVSTRLIAKIGDDLFGDAVRKIIHGHGPGLAEGLVVSPGGSTSYSIIISPPDADRMFLHAPGCNATFNENDIDDHSVSSARLFHFGYPPLMEQTFRNGGETLVSIFRRAKATGVTTSLDMSMPDMSGPAGTVDWAALLRKTLPWVDIFAPSIGELLLMLRPQEYHLLRIAGGDDGLIDLVQPGLLSALGDELLSLGAKIVAIKLGHRGLFLRTADARTMPILGRACAGDLHAWADRELWAPCFLAGVVGTTGSGDATVAGLLMGMLRGFPPEQCLTAACAVGGCSVEAADALGGVRSWNETQGRIDAGWSRLPLTIDAPGWNWNEAQAVWTGPSGNASHDASSVDRLSARRSG